MTLSEGPLKSKLGEWNGKAVMGAKRWGELSAAFSGCTALTQAARGGRQDKWNNIIGSFGAGMYLNRDKGVQNMVNSGLGFAGFSYLIDSFFLSSKSSPSKDELNYNELQIN